MPVGQIVLLSELSLYSDGQMLRVCRTSSSSVSIPKASQLFSPYPRFILLYPRFVVTPSAIHHFIVSTSFPSLSAIRIGILSYLDHNCYDQCHVYMYIPRGNYSAGVVIFYRRVILFGYASVLD